MSANQDWDRFFKLSRRRFLMSCGVAVAWPEFLVARANAAATIAKDDLQLDDLTYSVSYEFIRREDFARFLVCGWNIRETQNLLQRKYLISSDAMKPSYLVLVLPPQHIAEQVDPTTNADPSKPSAWSVSANTSRIAVRLDVDKHLNYKAVPVTFHGILSVFNSALLHTEASPIPSPSSTLIEAPTRLYLFPDATTRISTTVSPRQVRPSDHDEGRAPDPGTDDFELWSAEMTDPNGVQFSAFNGARDAAGKPKDDLAAVKTAAEQSQGSMVEALNDAVRDHLNFWSRQDGDALRPSRRPMKSDQAAFTSYGAQFALQWEAPYLAAAPDGPVTKYTHRIELARTALETVTYSGFIYPFFIPAVFVKRIAREPLEGEARLVSHQYVQLVRPDVSFDGPNYDKRVSCLLAAKRIALAPQITPDLATPASHQILAPISTALDKSVPEAFFLYTKSGAPFRWSLSGAGFENTTFNAEQASIFVLESIFDGANPAADFATIDAQWRSSGLHETPFARQAVAFAPRRTSLPNAPIGDPRTTLVTTMARYQAAYDGANRRFTPYLAAAQVIIPAVAELTGVEEAKLFRFSAQYQNEVADLKGAAQAVLVPLDELRAKFADDAAQTRNAVAALQNKVIGVSREYGAIVGAIEGDAQHQLDLLESGAKIAISSLFDMATSKVLGLFPLADLLGDVEHSIDSGLPTIVRQVIDQHTVEVQYKVSVPIAKPINDSHKFVAATHGQFVFLATARAALDSRGPAASTHIECAITGLDLLLPPSDSSILPGALTIPIKSIKMVSDGGTPRVSVDVGTPIFNSGSILSIIEGLADSLGLNGDALRQTIVDDVIALRTSIALPAIPAGALSIFNIALDFSIGLPLDQFAKAVTFAFGLSSHRNPFTVAVAFLGGSGYMSISLTVPGGKVGFQGSLALTAAADIDFAGVIKGTAQFNAGLELTTDTGHAVIAGYLNAWAAVSLFDIVSVSLSFEMKFAYDVGRKAFTGSVTVSVSVSIFFFSASEDVTISYTLGGGGSAPQRTLAAFIGDGTAAGELPGSSPRTANHDYWTRYAAKFAR